MTQSTDAPRVAIIGIHGYGASHVVHALGLQAESRLRLVGLVDPLVGPVVRDGLVIGLDQLPPIFPDTTTLLDAVDVDLVIVATPLHTHRALAELALRAGADVLLEKPPTTTLADLTALLELSRSSDARVQVGFQSLGSRALVALRRSIDDGALGEIHSIAASGSWVRDRRYWTRSTWAGKRTLNGRPVVDGVLTNPFAHAVMTSLSIAGWDAPDAIGSADLDLYRANDIEADDTSSFRLTPSATGAATFDGILSGAFTLAGPREDLPSIVVRGTGGSARLDYLNDGLILERNGEKTSQTYGREDLLENLLAHRIDGRPLLAPLEKTGAFVRFVEEVAGTPVHPIDPSHVRWQGDGLDAHPVLDGVENLVGKAAIDARLFRETGAAWAAEDAR
ncbi:putative dehydrogenase [Mycetocola sp. CAN_C7]|uniref:Gfo/Idh/MocA family protein n=1 Tax=Mycetocola sp. CAN_C7 TaxID=2787724 RepID=UPI0018CB4DFF